MTGGGFVLIVFILVSFGTIYFLIFPTITLPRYCSRFFVNHPQWTFARKKTKNEATSVKSTGKPVIVSGDVELKETREFEGKQFDNELEYEDMAKYEVDVPFWMPSILGIAIISVTGILPFYEVIIHKGIIGDEFIQPYAILTIFMTQAYICIALDSTGIFSMIAIKLAKKAGNSGSLAYLFYYALSAILALLASNDIVVLTMTPILLKFTSLVKVDPFPFILAKFFALNLWGAGLLTGNPTNIIISIALKISFPQFIKWMLLPTILSGLALYFILYRVLFYKSVNIKFQELPDMDAEMQAIRFDKSGATFGFLVLFLCLVMMIFSSQLGLELHVITTIFAAIYLSREVLAVVYGKFKGGSSKGKFEFSDTNPAENIEGVDSAADSVSIHANHQKTFRDIYHDIGGLPWSIIPFVISMFILVEGLDYTGSVDSAALWLRSIAQNANADVAMYVMWIVALILGNILDNQPMTILMTKILLKSKLSEVVGREGELLVSFGLIFGSNVTGNLTIVGALAGVMWNTVLTSKGVNIRAGTLLKYGLITMIPASLVFLVAIQIEKLIF
jgi:arsenical pump membrane protein